MRDMKCKIIFLDVDGVMKSAASTIRNGEDFKVILHPEHVEALNFILKKTDARIVLSSTYRMMWSVEETKAIFHEHGIDYKYVISHTPISHGQRGQQIKDWLDRYPQIARDKYKVNLVVDRYVVIDDDSDMWGIDMRNFVQTSKNYGLTHLEAQKAVNILNSDVVKAPVIVRKKYTKVI